jgi:hypothetical protein
MIVDAEIWHWTSHGMRRGGVGNGGGYFRSRLYSTCLRKRSMRSTFWAMAHYAAAEPPA